MTATRSDLAVVVTSLQVDGDGKRLPIGEIPVTSLNFSEVLNAPGACRFTFPLDLSDDDASVITTETLAPARSAIWVLSDGVVLWGGVLWVTSYDVTAGTVSCTAEGFLSYFRRRLLRETLTFTAEEQTTIAKELIDWAQAQSGGDLGVDTSEMEQTGTQQILRTRTRYYDFERHTIGELIENLAAVRDGFDFRFIPYLDPDDGFQVRVTTSRPQTGRVTNLIFDLDRSASQASVTIDGGEIANSVDVTGTGEGRDLVIVNAVDPGKLSSYPLLDAVEARSDVIETSTLSDIAAARLLADSTPIEIPALTMRADQEPKLGTYVVGDNVIVRMNAGILATDARCRITSYTVKWAANAPVEVTFTFTPATRFPS